MGRNDAVYFAFYVDDFLSATHYWKTEWIGAYVLLLLHQFQRGKLPKDRRNLEMISRLTAEQFDDFWESAQEKFEFDDEGHLVNRRMDEERKKSISLRQQRIDAGRLGGRPKTERKPSGLAELNRDETEIKANQNQNQNQNQKTEPKPKTRAKSSAGFRPPTMQQVAAYCLERKNGIDAEAFIARYQSQGWKLSNGQPMKCWKSAVINWEKKESRATGSKTFAQQKADNIQKQKDELRSRYADERI